ncbi:MAG: aspartate/glutamate racemase family protein [Magnetospirillum sp.]|nr:aspartate/glutamate racemase family protein [Magnetospirillum sp.]
MSREMVQIACLHTAESNVAVFDAALRTAGLSGVNLRHALRADLLAAAEQEGRLTTEIAAQAVAALTDLCAGADAVLLTCSTLGPVAEAAAANAAIPILRVDAALAAEAVKGGGKIVVLCAVETTVEPTKRLFEAAAQATGAEVRVQLVPGAWAAFKAGQQDRYLAMVARAAIEAKRGGAARVALAQASMAGASDLVAAGERPLNSPVAGLIAAAAAVVGAS